MCHKRLTVSFFLYWVLKKRHLCLNFLLQSHKWSSIRIHFSNLGVGSTQKRLFNESQLSSEVLSFRGPNIMGPWLQCNGANQVRLFDNSLGAIYLNFRVGEQCKRCRCEEAGTCGQLLLFVQGEHIPRAEGERHQVLPPNFSSGILSWTNPKWERLSLIQLHLCRSKRKLRNISLIWHMSPI